MRKRVDVKYARASLSSLHEALRKKYKEKAAFCFSPNRQKASLTVEAALITPLFITAMLLLLQMIDLYRLQGMLSLSLQESALELSVMDPVLKSEEEDSTSSGLLELAACILYAEQKIPGEIRKRGTVSLASSTLSNSKLILRAYYIPHRLSGLLPVSLFSVSAQAAVHLFDGRGPGDLNGADSEPVEMVYVTEYESVYHTDGGCSHIARSIQGIAGTQVDTMRNKSGSRYSPCEKCVGAGRVGGTVYISDYGSKYHNSTTCSGIKRTVRLVPKDSVPSLRVCSKCGARL